MKSNKTFVRMQQAPIVIKNICYVSSRHCVAFFFNKGKLGRIYPLDLKRILVRRLITTDEPDQSVLK